MGHVAGTSIHEAPVFVAAYRNVLALAVLSAERVLLRADAKAVLGEEASVGRGFTRSRAMS